MVSPALLLGCCLADGNNGPCRICAPFHLCLCVPGLGLRAATRNQLPLTTATEIGGQR